MRYVCLFTVAMSYLSFSLHGESYPHKFEGQFSGWNEKRLSLISLFLPEEPVILHAGGHYGGETLMLSRQWPYGQVIAFEPNPHAFQILSTNAKYSYNISTYPLALSDRSGNAPFYICHGSSGENAAFEHASSLLPPSQAMQIHYRGPIIEVECTKLDDWCPQNKVDRIDFISLNLQGAELQALKGSPEILKTVSCIAVHTHLFAFRDGITQYSELKQFLEKSGFRLLSHWYREGLEGDAIFVKNDFFMSDSTADFLRSNRIKKLPHHDLSYASNVRQIIDDLVKAESIAIDIGAHFGAYTVTMSNKVGPKGAVIAFEPNQTSYRNLLRTLETHHCTNVLPISKNLGEDLSSLDSLKLDNISLIRLGASHDILTILTDAEETILNNRPVLLMEGSVEENLTDLMESYGYETYTLDEHYLIAFPEESINTFSNYIQNLQTNS